MFEGDIAGLSLLVFAGVVCAAFLAGLIDSIAGGGGLISVPAMLVAGVPPHYCLGTNKLMCFMGTAASCITFFRNKTIVLPIVAVGAGFSFVGSLLGAQLVLYVDPAILGKVIVLLLPLAGATVLFPMKPGKGQKEFDMRRLWLIAPPLCFLIGLYDGFYGPGTGSFLLLGLHFFLGLPLLQASATAKPFNLASNISAAVIFIVNGSVLYSLGIPMMIANILGNVIGSRLALKLGAPAVRKMLIFSLLLLFGSLLQKYYL